MALTSVQKKYLKPEQREPTSIQKKYLDVAKTTTPTPTEKETYNIKSPFLDWLKQGVPLTTKGETTEYKIPVAEPLKKPIAEYEKFTQTPVGKYVTGEKGANYVPLTEHLALGALAVTGGMGLYNLLKDPLISSKIQSLPISQRVNTMRETGRLSKLSPQKLAQEFFKVSRSTQDLIRNVAKSKGLNLTELLRPVAEPQSIKQLSFQGVPRTAQAGFALVPNKQELIKAIQDITPKIPEAQLVGMSIPALQSKLQLYTEAKKHKTVEEFVEKTYNDLAKQQRDKPEKSMVKLQQSQISQLYGWATEHGGDIMHRMNEEINFFKGGYAIDKIEKVLRTLKESYGFEKEINEQVKDNLEYQQKQGKLKGETVDSRLRQLKDLSQNYANEHKKLPTYNDAQKLAQDVAVSIGEWRFDDAIKALETLKSKIDSKEWEGFISEGKQLTDIWNKAQPTGPPTPPITSAPEIPQPDDTPVSKLTKVLKQAKPIRGKQETLKRKEQARRFQTAEALSGKGAGMEGFFKELGALKGAMPKADYQPILGDFSEADVDKLFDAVKQSPNIQYLEKVTARNALLNLFNEAGAKLPTKGEIKLLEKVFPKELIDELSKQNALGTLKHISEQLVNLPRSILSSFDVSFGLRQGAYVLPRHPKEWGKAFIKQFQGMGSDKAFQSVMTKIEGDPLFKLAQESGISFTDVGTDITEREEKFLSSWAERIPVVGGRGIPLKFGKLQFDTPSLSIPYVNIASSARAYTAMANTLRMDIFKTLVNDLKVITGEEINYDLSKQIATFVNAATGRGSLPESLQGMASILNGVFFSPRLFASRVQLLNPVRYVKAEPGLRRKTLETLIAFAGTVITILTLAKLSGAEVETDPTSSDFGKIKIGDTRIDIAGGFLQYVVLGARLLMGSMKSSTTGKIIKLGEGYKPLTRLDLLTRFIEYKQAPVASFVTTMLKGKGLFGEDLKVSEEVKKRFIPMVIQDLIDTARDNPKLLPVAALGIFGVGIQTYKGRVGKGKKKKRGSLTSIQRKYLK